MDISIPNRGSDQSIKYIFKQLVPPTSTSPTKLPRPKDTLPNFTLQHNPVYNTPPHIKMLTALHRRHVITLSPSFLEIQVLCVYEQ